MKKINGGVQAREEETGLIDYNNIRMARTERRMLVLLNSMMSAFLKILWKRILRLESVLAWKGPVPV